MQVISMLRQTYYKSSDLASRNVERKVVQHNGVWSGGIRKCNVFDLDIAVRLAWLLAACGKSVNVGFPVNEDKHLRGAGGGPRKLNRVRREVGEADGSNDDRQQNTVNEKKLA